MAFIYSRAVPGLSIKLSEMIFEKKIDVTACVYDFLEGLE